MRIPMKKVIDLAMFLAGVLVITVMLFTARGHDHSAVLKMEFHEVQPSGTMGT